MVHAAGGSVNGYLTTDALLPGNKIIAGPPQLHFHTGYKPRTVDLHDLQLLGQTTRMTDGGHTRRTGLGYPTAALSSSRDRAPRQIHAQLCAQ